MDSGIFRDHDRAASSAGLMGKDFIAKSQELTEFACHRIMKITYIIILFTVKVVLTNPQLHAVMHVIWISK